MGQQTGIEWTDATWNPIMGCRKVSAGCKNCYMYRDMARFGRDPFTVVRAKDGTFYNPLKWKKPRKIFTCSWSDFFIEEADPWRDQAWEVIRKTPQHTYQILTKRPENIRDCLPFDWGDDGWSNVWLGVSVESSNYLWRIVSLGNVPAIVRFVSYEPALAYVDFIPYSPAIDWLISGGESGPNARLAKLDWFRQVRDDCLKHNIPYFHKQHGGSKKINGAWGGRLLDGVEWNQFPHEST